MDLWADFGGRRELLELPERRLKRCAAGEKESLPRKGLKFCGRPCYLRYSVEVAKPIEKGRARLAEMRASGLRPGHGGEAAKKRGAVLATNNRLRVTGRGARKHIVVAEA